jgi:hypothetical protein
MRIERARHPLLIALTALSAACFPTGLKPMTLPPRIIAKDYVPGTICGVFPRAAPECNVLLDPVGWDDRNRCPVVKVEYDFGEDESPTAAPVLAALAEEVVRIPHLTDVQIVVAAGEGEGVRVLDRRYHRLVAALGALGIAPPRFSRAYQPSGWRTGYAKFEAFACDRKEIVRQPGPDEDR